MFYLYVYNIILLKYFLERERVGDGEIEDKDQLF